MTRVAAPVRLVHPQRAMPVSRPVQVTPYHRVPESQRQPIIHSGPLPQSSTQWNNQRSYQQNYQRAPVARAPAVHAPMPRSAPMPAPQVRFNEPRFNRGYQSAAGGSRGGNQGGGNRGGGHHKG